VVDIFTSAGKVYLFVAWDHPLSIGGSAVTALDGFN